MTDQQISDLMEGSAALVASFSSFLLRLSSLSDAAGATFNTRSGLPATPISPADWMARISAVDGIIQKFDKSANILMIPQSRLKVLRQSVEHADRNIKVLQSQLFSFLEGSGGLDHFNYENFQAHARNGQAQSFTNQFNAVSDAVDSLLDAFYSVLVIARPTKANFNFQAAASALSAVVDSIRIEFEALKRKSAQFDDLLDRAMGDSETISGVALELKRLRDEGAADRKSITEYVADASTKISSISEIYREALGLESEIGEYTEKFQSFDRQIKEREDQFRNGAAQFDLFIKKFLEQDVFVGELIQRSEDMLKGATVAGLAGRFEQIRRELTKELSGARRAFYVGIFFLFISAIPLMAFVFLPIIGPFFENSAPWLSESLKLYHGENAGDGWRYLGQVFARFIILLPAAWFVSFSAIRHSSLFRLREHYSYKYSMAVSVEGFKKQAKGYEDEIAALVLEQLAFNPADKLVPSKEIPEGKIPHPIMNALVGKLRRTLEKNSTDSG